MNKNKKIYNMITKVAIFSALSVILYFFPKFPLPFFPSFLEINFSNLPILIGGFTLGPVGGALIVIIRFLIKLPFSHTAYVGELSDLILSLIIVLTSSIFYKYHRTKKGGLIALVITLFVWVVSAVLINYFINIPAYLALFFGGNVSNLVGALSVIKGVNESNYMGYYLLYAVVPFNLLLGSVVCLITFLVYKQISNIFKKDFFSKGEHKDDREENKPEN